MFILIAHVARCHPLDAVTATTSLSLQLVTENWQAMAADGRAMVRRVTWSWLEYSAQNTKVPGFIINKIAQLIAFVASQEYPQLWPSFFRDLLGGRVSSRKGRRRSHF